MIRRPPISPLFPYTSSSDLAASTYVRRPPFFEKMAAHPAPVTDVHGARVLAILGDSVTTDHISPAGNIAKNSPARSEEHTSELQSRQYLVCRLLLEKKKERK